MVIGEMAGGVSERVKCIARAFEEARLTVESHENVVAAIWQKFIFICGLSGMTALTRKPLGEIFKQSVTTEMYRRYLRRL